MDKLEKSRKNIDAIDKKLAGLLFQRLKAAIAIASYKKKTKTKIKDGKREAKVINNIKKSSKNNKYVIEIYKKIIEVSRKSQK